MELPRTESLTVEFKSEASRAMSDSEIVDNIVALANTDGGDLYLGIEDDGKPTGVSRQHRNTDLLAAYVFNHTVPPLQVRPSLLQADGANVVRISVMSSSQLVCSRAGRVTHRVLKADGSPEVVTMYPYEFMSRLSSIGRYDYSAQPAPDAKPEDLDPLARERLREQIAASHADAGLLELNDDAFDGALGLSAPTERDGDRIPTVAGILMIGTRKALSLRMPTAGITFQVMRDGTPVVDETLRMPLVSALPRIEELLKPWNHIANERFTGMTRRNIMDYNPEVLREAVLNAVCHRDYSILAPVAIQLDQTGLTVSSPGGFMRGVDVDNLLTVSPSPRNQALADVLKRCGYVERTGRGVDRIYAGTVASGRPFPDYSQSTSERVVLFLRAAHPDAVFMDMLDEAERRRGAKLNNEDVLVMAALYRHSGANVDTIRRVTTLDDSRVRGALEALLKDDVAHSDNDSYVLFEKKDEGEKQPVDTQRYRKLLLERVHLNGGSITTSEAMELLGLNYLTAYRLLKSMQQDGLVDHEGRGRASRFVLPKISA